MTNNRTSFSSLDKDAKNSTQSVSTYTFEAGILPTGWILSNGNLAFERGCLHSGKMTRLHFPIEGNGWKKWRVEIEVQCDSGAVITCGNGIMHLVADLTRGEYHAGVYGGALLGGHRQALKEIKGSHRVAFEFNQGELRIYVNGDEMLMTRDIQSLPAFGWHELSFWENCLVSRITVIGEGPLDRPVFCYQDRKDPKFHLEVAVDFYDDLLHAVWTAEMLDQLFEVFKSWGVKRCHWIYEGKSGDSLLTDAGAVVSRNAVETIRNIGEIFPAAVKAAHRQGIEIYGILKPFEAGVYHPSLGEGMPDVREKGKLKRIGGWITRILDFPATRREYSVARKPGNYGPAKNEIFTRVDLVKDDEDKAAFTIEDIQLFVSDDNTTYRPYEGPISREELIEDYPIWEHTASGGRSTERLRRCRVMRLDNLCLREKYFALKVDSQKKSFINNFINLIHVFGEAGEERMLTYGVLSRGIDLEITANTRIRAKNRDFRQTGIEFDVMPGKPTAHCPGNDAIAAPYIFDSRDGLLGVARGKDMGPIAILSPAFQEAREWWLSRLRECLDAGADGIELRVRNHHSPFAWAEFGFEQPVRDAFLARHGVDLWETDDFDKAAWRRLRGESYTEFYRQARKLAHSYGKKMGVHISPSRAVEPEWGAAMEIHWDWRTWIDEGLADSITMKEVWPGTRFAEEILKHARQKGVQVIFSPYANNIWNGMDGKKLVNDWITLAKENGYDGFQYYECAALIKGTSDEKLVVEQPDLKPIFQKAAES